MPIFTHIRTAVFSLAVVVCSPFAFAQTQNADSVAPDDASNTVNNVNDIDLEQYVKDSYVPTYDCPETSVVKEIDALLARPDLKKQQELALLSQKSHALICDGNFLEAQNIVRNLLANNNADRGAHYYSSAIFQFGFIYDVQENPEKCNYYLLAQDAAKDRYVDVHTSATLGYLTECLQAKDDFRLIRLYDLLEQITRTGDAAALAHAHNRVGLFYGSLGQHSLAASQYKRAYEISKPIYTDANKISILVSAMTSTLTSNNLEEAKLLLDELEMLNENVNTLQSNFLVYFASAGYYIQSKDMESLEEVLNKWRGISDRITNPIYRGLFRWYNSELCLYNGDRQCLEDFLTAEANAPERYLAYVNNSKTYLYFLARVHVYLGDKDSAQIALENYSKRMLAVQKGLQRVTESMGVAQLQNQILTLESRLEQQKENRSKMIVAVLVLLASAIALVIWFFQRKYSTSRQLDSVTGLLNTEAVIDKLNKLDAPSSGKTNALAIFDIDNFTEVNLTLGVDKSEYVLQQIAQTLCKITRNTDILGVLGPNRFVLCLVDIEEEAAQAFFERVKAALANTFVGENKTKDINVDSSMSLYFGTDTFADINDILENMLMSLSFTPEHFKNKADGDSLQAH